EIAAYALQEGPHDSRQHAQLRRQDLARPAAAALDEELERVALSDHHAEVAMEDQLVELVVVEGSADEERPGAAQEPAERPEREVDAGGDVRRRQEVVAEDVRQDHVVEVAAVAWNQHHRVLLDAVDDSLEAAHLEAGEGASPDLMEGDLDDAERETVEVGGDLPEGIARLAPDPALGHPSPARDFIDRPPHLGPLEDALGDHRP